MHVYIFFRSFTFVDMGHDNSKRSQQQDNPVDHKESKSEGNI